MPITTAADDIYIILADDSSCFFDVCVCVCVCVYIYIYIYKMSSSKKLAWCFKSPSIHCSHNVYTGDCI